VKADHNAKLSNQSVMRVSLMSRHDPNVHDAHEVKRVHLEWVHLRCGPGKETVQDDVSIRADGELGRVLPRLQPVPIQPVMQRLIVVERLVAVVDEIEHGRHQSAQQQELVQGRGKFSRSTQHKRTRKAIEKLGTYTCDHNLSSSSNATFGGADGIGLASLAGCSLSIGLLETWYRRVHFT